MNKKKFTMAVGAVTLVLLIIPIMLAPVILFIYNFWIIAFLLIFLYYILNSIALMKIYSNKRSDIQTKITWTFIQLFFPGVGAYIFYVFGRFPNRVKKRLRESKLLENDLLPKDIRNSRIDILTNGNEKFSKLFEALENAKEYINIQYFIINPGIIQDKFFSILNKKANEGVKIKILYDYLGCPKWSYKAVCKRRRENIEIVEFRPITWSRPSGADNWRSHNKIIVIDGQQAFFGSINIGDEYASLSGHYGDWIDVHYLCRGKVVDSLNAIFFVHWFIQTGENISSNYLGKRVNIEYGYDELEIIIDSPDREKAVTFEKLKEEIRNAKKSIKIITPYVAFPLTFKQVVRDATNRGVKIKIITIGKADKLSAYYQGSFDIETLNDFGVETYRIKNLFIHTKMFIFDDEKVIFGTTNLDYRALFQHFETNLLLKDKDVSKWVDYFDQNMKYTFKKNEKRDDWTLGRTLMYFIVRLFKGLF